MTLGVKPVKGIDSPGMLCARTSSASATITRHRRARRGRPTALGAPAQRALGVDDWVLDVNVPANRGDCLGHLGLARELAALLGGKLVLPDLSAISPSSRGAGTAAWSSSRSPITPSCAALRRPRDRRRHRRPSPRRFAQRLRAVGVRPISNLVDVTNYVLFELGQPLHAFDWHRLAAPPRIGVAGPRRRRAAHDARRVGPRAGRRRPGDHATAPRASRWPA
jgi:phenylalanyl-tRNA synthetase beta chain